MRLKAERTNSITNVTVMKYRQMEHLVKDIYQFNQEINYCTQAKYSLRLLGVSCNTELT